MATRQYIGARYVPKFFSGEGGSTEWVSGVQYEPLTIVTHLGNSYTSKKPVPVGIDILNTEYWASTGMWNAQVESIREELEEYKDETDDKFAKLNNKAYIIIADSLANYHNADGDNFIEYAMNKLNIDSDHYYDLHEGGYGFYDNGFLSLLQNATITNKDSITDIIIMCGWNDINHLSELNTYIEAFVNYTKENYVNASIKIGIDVWTPFDNASTAIFRNLVPTFMNCCIENNIEFIPNCNSCLHATDYYANDGVHPSESGVTQLGKILVNVILNNDGFVPINDTLFSMKSSDGTISGFLYYSVTKQGLKIWCDYSESNHCTISFTSNKNIVNNNFVDCGEMELTGWNVLNPHNNAIFCKAIVTINGSDTVDDIAFYIKGNHLYLMDITRTRQNVESIVLFPFTQMLNIETN